LSFQRRVEHVRYGAGARRLLGVSAVAVYFVLYRRSASLRTR
jgi:hypothetical protein